MKPCTTGDAWLKGGLAAKIDGAATDDGQGQPGHAKERGEDDLGPCPLGGLVHFFLLSLEAWFF